MLDATIRHSSSLNQLSGKSRSIAPVSGCSASDTSTGSWSVRTEGRNPRARPGIAGKSRRYWHCTDDAAKKEFCHD